MLVDFKDKMTHTITIGINHKTTPIEIRERFYCTTAQQELLFDPQTSGGLLIAVVAKSAPSLLDALLASGHSAAEVGEILDGPPRLEVA